MIDNKMILRGFGLLAAATLFTCTDVRDYCPSTGLHYDPYSQFCSADGSKTIERCDNDRETKYNPLTQGCIKDGHLAGHVGTKCADATLVKLGTPCDGYALSIGVAPAIGGSVEVQGVSLGNANFAADAPVALLAMPAEGYRFIGWAGSENTRDRRLPLTMDGNKSLIAMFSFGDAVTLVATAFPREGGTVSVGGGAAEPEVVAEYGENDPATVTAAERPGYAFDGWSGSGGFESNERTVNITMQDSKTLVAMFKPVVYTLKINTIPEAGGTVYVNSTALADADTANLSAGTAVTLLAVPENDYRFTGWSEATGTNIQIPPTNSTTIYITSGNVTINAYFERGVGVVVPPPDGPGGGDTTGTRDTTYSNYPVTIGDLTWTGKNLNINTPDSWCYDDDPANCAKYGRLYTWEDAKIACAGMGGGWRLPDNEDWDYLVDLAGGRDVAGEKLKSKSGWNSNFGTSGNGTDELEFSALPGGYRPPGNSATFVGYYGYWWSETEFGASGAEAYYFGMGFMDGIVASYGFDKGGGGSVRCVQGEPPPPETPPPPPPPPGTPVCTLTVGTTPMTGGGTVSVSGPVTESGPSVTVIGASKSYTYSCGAQVTVQATAAMGYMFTGWTGSGGETLANPSAAIANSSGRIAITANFEERIVTYTLSVSRNLTAGGTIYVNGNPSSGSTTHNSGAEVTVTVYEADGYTFTGWTGASESTSPSIAITMNGDRALTAHFEQSATPLNVNAFTAGSITSTASGTTALYSFSVTGGNSYYVWLDDSDAGNGKTLDAKISARYGTNSLNIFTSVDQAWSTPRSFTASQTGTVYLEVAPLNSGGTGTFAVAYNTSSKRPGTPDTYTLWTNVNPPNTGGTATPARLDGIAAGSTVTVAATPATGYGFLNWTVANSNAAIANPSSATTQVTVNSDVVVTANFEQQTITYTLSVSRNLMAGGTMYVNGDASSGSTTHASGASVNVTAQANPGYTFVGWSGASESTSPSIAITMNENKTLVANFQQITYTLTVSQSVGGTVKVGGGTASSLGSITTHNSGVAVNVTAEEVTGYTFTGWSEASTSTSRTVLITMNENKMLAANFELQAAVTPVSTVMINGVTWTKENLNINTSDSWCYDGDPANCAIYGRLYTWEAAKSACESMGDGWRLPSNGDWDNLVDYAGGASTAGKKLKSTSGWNDNGSGDNAYGFSAMPGGSRIYSNGSFGSAGRNGYWWSATEYVSDYAYRPGMGYDNDSVYEGISYRSNGFSVRCVSGSQD